MQITGDGSGFCECVVAAPLPVAGWMMKASQHGEEEEGMIQCFMYSYWAMFCLLLIGDSMELRRWGRLCRLPGFEIFSGLVLALSVICYLSQELYDRLPAAATLAVPPVVLGNLLLSLFGGEAVDRQFAEAFGLPGETASEARFLTLLFAAPAYCCALLLFTEKWLEKFSG